VPITQATALAQAFSPSRLGSEFPQTAVRRSQRNAFRRYAPLSVTAGDAYLASSSPFKLSIYAIISCSRVFVKRARCTNAAQVAVPAYTAGETPQNPPAPFRVRRLRDNKAQP